VTNDRYIPGMTTLAHTTAIRHALSAKNSDAVAQAIANAVQSDVVPMDTVQVALDWLVTQPARAHVGALQQAVTALGRVALALSGGASLGFFHMGVIKALHENNALPDLISGSSIGAMVAAGIGVRTDDELDTLFRDIHHMRRDGIAFAGVRQMLKTGAVLCPEQLTRVLTHNIGDHTFAEAYGRTGRTLAITVSPTTNGQTPLLLTYNNAPDTTVLHSVLASSALPGLFPPTRLRTRTPDGRRTITAERWADGSLRYDVPRDALRDEHGAGLVIASQTNIHVLPFAAGGRVLRSLGKTRSTARQLLRLPRHLSRRTPLGPSLHHLHDLVGQNYRGDIDIVPRLRPSSVIRVVKNPSLDELRAYIQEGMTSTLPELPRIQTALRIRRSLRAAIESMTVSVAHAAK
jgi:TAG lipase/steryl ester hydrolase/phospholipase A2/LPA acyltransferase